jgi:hypothetical protein
MCALALGVFMRYQWGGSARVAGAPRGPGMGTCSRLCTHLEGQVLEALDIAKLRGLGTRARRRSVAQPLPRGQRPQGGSAGRLLGGAGGGGHEGVGNRGGARATGTRAAREKGTAAHSTATACSGRSQAPRVARPAPCPCHAPPAPRSQQQVNNSPGGAATGGCGLPQTRDAACARAAEQGVGEKPGGGGGGGGALGLCRHAAGSPKTPRGQGCARPRETGGRSRTQKCRVRLPHPQPRRWAGAAASGVGPHTAAARRSSCALPPSRDAFPALVLRHIK